MGPVADYFDGQCVLVTGASGFIGKILIEKILRSCPQVHRIFIIIREKRNLSPDQRWSQLRQLPLYDKLNEENPAALQKVQVFHGDMGLPDLGISQQDKEFLTENTTLVFHSAAAVQFDQPLPVAIKLNTRSTYLLLELAKQMPKLKGFVYVSTTYANFNRPPTEWEEQVYPASQDWRVLNRLADRENLTLSILRNKRYVNSAFFRILENHPNTYTLTKSMAENVAQEYSAHFPVIILRPSVVSAVVEDPLLGWIDNLSGSVAIATTTGLGLTRTFYGLPDCHQDHISANSVVRGLIVAAARDANKTSGLTVYNCTYGKHRHCTNEETTEYLYSSFFLPSKYLIWPPSYKAVTNYNWYFFLMFFQMVIPFYILDRLAIFKGEKPRLVYVAKKIANASAMFKKFVTMKIIFPKEKYEELKKSLHEEDKDDFNLEQIKMSAIKEIAINFEGILKYYFKEDLSPQNLRRNAKRLEKLIIVKTAWRVLYYTSAAVILFKYCPYVREVVSCIIEMYNEYITA